MTHSNRFRFYYQDLSRLVFERELTAQDIFFRSEENLDHMVLPSSPQFVYYVADKDFSKAYKIFDKIAGVNDYQDPEVPAMFAVYGVVLFSVFILMGILGYVGIF
ncbi:MAG: hypothetical protein GY810_19475 [Aureispira sp.]|nr:hypothetical protein [Aureispira sp.]